MDTALDLIKWAEGELMRSNIASARYDAEMIFMDTFRNDREEIYLTRPFIPAEKRLRDFRNHIGMRSSRYPLQYILKKADFMGLVFRLEESVFIPRPDTERLIEKLAEYVKNREMKNANVLEIGTGCGNIAISLTKNITGCKIMASDISDKALEIAIENARYHGVEGEIEFVKSDLFENISPACYNYFDIIVSNPPYIRKKDIRALQPEVLFEDEKALDGGEDGIRFFRKILGDGLKYLKEDGFFAFEISYDQADDIKKIVNNYERLTAPIFNKDYNGYDRVAIIPRVSPIG